VEIGVEIDTSKVERMFDGIVERSQNLDRVAENAIRDTVVSGIPVLTGKLEASPRIRVIDGGAEVYTDVPYANYVFEGTDRQDPQPPKVDFPAFADQVAEELFR
jgi:hypothetical protein